ncbi:YlbF family regulator [Fictibacillus sp. KIGAM418]|uniref:YlbF family regulator n=1 Tax=Fictibacillus marinisediminis TaxID=2878389 RepID=A0A9X1XG19_9BACL|nr:YlbF family regulator [Fictibacillus marinisediminis]MCK6256889.1 YlbF family regulator [Fictibacillus marinisediminis]
MLGLVLDFELLDETYSLGKMIAESEAAIQYRVCKYNLEQDANAQKLINEFNKTKELYEEVQRFGKYHPDYKTVSTKVRVLKRELDFNETIAGFKKAEKELESLLNECSSLIAGSVSEHIKVPTGNPFFDSKSCSGGCGSGGGCSCS